MSHHISTMVLPPKLKVLMVDPEYFDIKYSINPFMKDASGHLKKIDKIKAIAQWTALSKQYKRLGFEVIIIKARDTLPDMVFAANQSFPFWLISENRPAVIMSQMASSFRRAEVSLFTAWYKERGYKVFNLPDESLTFEGNGDVLIQGSIPVIWAASGPRTDPKVADYLHMITGYEVNTLKLRHADFYHLDTCFSILNDTTVAIYPGAFDHTDLLKIRTRFDRVIEIDFDECYQSFAGNCHSPDGKHVLIQLGAKHFNKALEESGFSVIEVDTSEFMKSGGSVFCLKMMAY